MTVPIADRTAGIIHVFIRDMVMPASIGVLPHEHAAPQRVRINVDLAVKDIAEEVGPDEVGRVVDYGKIAAGTPIEALRDSGSQIEVPIALLGNGEHYALEVAGDSMIEAGILDGDTVLIKKTEGADTGDIVVALIDDEEATLKRFRRRGASIALEPANASYEVRILPPTRVRIQGKMVGLFRRY